MTDHWIEHSTRNPYVRLLGLLLGLFFFGWAVYGLRGVLTPVFISFLIAYLLDPVVDRFEARGVNRTAAITILMAGLFVLTGVGIFLIGLAVSELADVIKSLPTWLEGTVHGWRQSWQDMAAVIWISENLGVDIRNVDAEYALSAIRSLREQLLAFLPRLAGPVRSILTHALSGTVALVSWAANIILIPLFSFYLLRDFDIIIAHIKELLPRPYRAEITKIFKDIDLTIAAFVRGQLLVMVILGVLYGIGLTIFRVKMGFGIGLLAGLLCIIPYFGTAIGVILALLMSLMGGEYLVLNLIGTVVTFGLVQILEGTVITPKIVGDKVGLHPVWVILALMVGAHVLGVLGMLLAIPLAAVIRIILQRAIKRYKASTFFDLGAARFSLSALKGEKKEADADQNKEESDEEEATEDQPSKAQETSQKSNGIREMVDQVSHSAGIRESVDAEAHHQSSPSHSRVPKVLKPLEGREVPPQISTSEAAPVPESGSKAIRGSVDAAAQASTGVHEALENAERHTRSEATSFAPNANSPSDRGKYEKWENRIGRHREPRTEKHHLADRGASKTLPNHPIDPALRELIDEQKRESLVQKETTDEADTSQTLTGIPAMAKDEDEKQ